MAALAPVLLGGYRNPFADPAISAACRHNDGGPHAPAHAFGACTSCSTTVEAATAGPGQTAWFE